MYKKFDKYKRKSSSITIGLVGAIISAIVSMVSTVFLFLGVEVDVSFNYLFSLTADDNGGKLMFFPVNSILVFVVPYFTTAISCISYNWVSRFTGGVSYSQGESEFLCLTNGSKKHPTCSAIYAER
jgi:hypothetical protein